MAYAQPVVVIDAGSTGSRLFVYDYAPTASGALPKVTLLATRKDATPLAEFAAHPAAAAGAIARLLDVNHMDAAVKKAPVYLLATAGMRLIAQPAQAAIYAAINVYLKENTDFSPGLVGTITGRQEGLFDWLAVNYARGTLLSYHTYGVLDMGGASTEIAYQTDFKHANMPPVVLAGVRLYTQSHSFLGLGQDRAREQYPNNKNCYYLHYLLPNMTRANGNIYQCERDVSRLINVIHRVNERVHDVPKGTRFVALSGFEYIAHEFGFDDQVTPHALLERAHHACAQPMSHVTENPMYRANYCFYTAYVYGLMVQGYKMNPHQPVEIFEKKKNDTLSWTMGAVLYYLSGASK